jgi:transcription elongation factor Elf1
MLLKTEMEDYDLKQKERMQKVCKEQWKKLYKSGWRVFPDYECPKCGEGAVIIMAETKNEKERGHMECVKCLWRTF